MITNKEELLLVNETCFALKKGLENGEDFSYAAGDLYQKYNDPNLHPVFHHTIWQTLQNTSYVHDYNIKEI